MILWEDDSIYKGPNIIRRRRAQYAHVCVRDRSGYVIVAPGHALALQSHMSGEPDPERRMPIRGHAQIFIFKIYE